MVKRFDSRKLIPATVAACIALSTYVIAGPRSDGRGYAGQSGPNAGQQLGSQNNPGMFGSQPNDNSGNPRFDRQNNPGVQDRDSDRTRPADSDATETGATETGATETGASEPDRSNSVQAGGNGSEHRSSGSGFFSRRGDEQVETREERSKAGGSESSEHRSEKSEVSKKFESSLLLADVARAPSATSGSANRSGPTNNPGLDHMSQQGLQNSEAGRTTAQNAIDNHHNPLRQRERLNEQEIERVREFLQHNLTAQQKEGLKRILEDGLTPTEREELRDFFKERVTPKQWEALKVFLNHKINESD